MFILGPQLALMVKWDDGSRVDNHPSLLGTEEFPRTEEFP